MKAESITEQLLFSTVRIEANRNDGALSVATGFVVHHKDHEDHEYPFLVTNRHVIQDTSSGQFTLSHAVSDVDYRPLLGKKTPAVLNEDRWTWIAHPSDDIDIAVLSLAPIFEFLSAGETSYFIKSIATTLGPTGKDIEDFDAVEEVLFVGYPKGIYDTVNNLPIARRGITATPLSVDYEGRPIFLIDASVFPGSSGSPVFQYSPSARLDRKGQIGRRQVFWLGIVAEVYCEEYYGVPELQERILVLDAKVKSRQMIDLGIVYKASSVIEVIEHALLYERSELNLT